MSRAEFEHLALERQRRRRWTRRLWREWCFLHVLVRHFAVRVGVMIVVLVGGAVLFLVYGREEVRSFGQGLFYTWRLIFAEQPDNFPASRVLDVMCFVLPVIGLTVIIEGIIDFALVLRDRKRFERNWCEMMAQSMQNHIVLVGFGRLGYSVYLLLRKLGEQVVVIERDPRNQFIEELRRDGVPLFVGDARREALLKDANITAAKSIICAADDDLANLEIALDARRVSPEIRVILRMFDQNMADKIGSGFDIRLAMSQSAVSAPAFAMSAVDASIIHSFVVGDELVVMQRWNVSEGEPLCGKNVAEVMHAHGVTIVKRRGPGHEMVLFPPPSTIIQAGDSLIVQGRYDVLRKLAGYAEQMR